MGYEYTAQTPNGEKTFQTDHHHSSFDSIEEFVTKHKDVLGLVVTAAGTILTNGVSIWLGRGKMGQKLR